MAEHRPREGWYGLYLDNEEKQILIVYTINRERVVSVGTEPKAGHHSKKGIWSAP
jgi:hypothetical protein